MQQTAGSAGSKTGQGQQHHAARGECSHDSITIQWQRHWQQSTTVLCLPIHVSDCDKNRDMEVQVILSKGDKGNGKSSRSMSAAAATGN